MIGQGTLPSFAISSNPVCCPSWVRSRRDLLSSSDCDDWLTFCCTLRLPVDCRLYTCKRMWQGLEHSTAADNVFTRPFAVSYFQVLSNGPKRVPVTQSCHKPALTPSHTSILGVSQGPQRVQRPQGEQKSQCNGEQNINPAQTRPKPQPAQSQPKPTHISADGVKPTEPKSDKPNCMHLHFITNCTTTL